MKLAYFAAAPALFLLCSAGAAAEVTFEAPRPPLWRISDGESTAYLFGSIGLAPGAAKWRSKAVARAIDQSEIVWVEAPVDDADAAADANRYFDQQGKLPAGASLSSLLPPQTAAALGDIAEKAGIEVEALLPLRPWAAFVILSSRVNADNADAETVEQAILREARGRGRDLRYLDSVGHVLGILIEMKPKTQIELLSELIADFDAQRDGAANAFEAWRTGDLDALDAYLSARLRAEAPEAYEALIAGRVKDLADRVTAAIGADQTAFISLNVSYLTGPDALPDRLREMGYVVERIAE